VAELIDAIEQFLGWKNTSDAFLVGAGSLGSALLGYEGFKEYRLNVLAGFDANPVKIGTHIHGKEIFAMDKLPDLIRRMHVLIGILTVPAAAAQQVADVLVGAGIRAIWNYTPVQLQVPDGVIVEDVKLAASLAVLSSRLAEMLRKKPVLAEPDVPVEAKEEQSWSKI
jgi:redox-sensing transcriptional repressor